MFRRLFLMCLVVSVLCSFVSCDKEHPNATDSKVSKETLVLTYDEGAHVEINASYPVFHLEDDAVNERINGVVKAYVDSLYDFYYEKKPFVATDTLYSTMLYDVTLFDEQYVSIHFYTSRAGSGAPQYVSDSGFTFSLETGELVPLDEFYTAEQIKADIDTYFDALDESTYPTLFFLYTKEDVKADFLRKFSEDGQLHSYYLSDETLYLIAGHYKGYTWDIESPLHGDRPFIVEINIEKSSES